MPSEAADRDAPGQKKVAERAANASQDALAREGEQADEEGSRTLHTPLPDSPTPVPGQKERRSPPSRGPQPFDKSEREEMENLLHELRGHLGMYTAARRTLTYMNLA